MKHSWAVRREFHPSRLSSNDLWVKGYKSRGGNYERFPQKCFETTQFQFVGWKMVQHNSKKTKQRKDVRFDLFWSHRLHCALLAWWSSMNFLLDCACNFAWKWWGYQNLPVPDWCSCAQLILDFQAQFTLASWVNAHDANLPELLEARAASGPRNRVV